MTQKSRRASSGRGRFDNSLLGVGISIGVLAIPITIFLTNHRDSFNRLELSAVWPSAAFGIIISLWLLYRRPEFGVVVLIVNILVATTLFILAFAWTYWSFSPRPYSCMNVGLTKVDSIYFTLTTLSTVGYGDIAPMTQECRIVVSLQLIGGIIFVVFIFGLLVARIVAERST
jgi:hypothetical protein